MKKKGIIVLFVIALVLGIGIFVLLKKDKKPEEVVVPEVEVIDSIDSFDYNLNDNETEYYKKLFNSLKDLLSQSDYDENEYASLVGKLFLCDFYDLNSKVMKSDVGGTQFVYSEYRYSFEKGAIDTVYNSVESNVYGDRNQVLPIVTGVEVDSIYTDSFSYDDGVDYDAYYIDFSISYETDLDYPNSVSLVLIHNNDKLEIAKMETK